MERFVVGTGRCGSTLLSTMLAEHPDALVLSEFFGGINRPHGFTSERVSGKEFATTLARGNLFADFIRSQSIRLKESLHEVSGDFASEQNESPSPIVGIALAFISNEPEALFREILALVASWPVRPIHDHYVELFTWLQRRNGKKYWLERSGLSWEFFPELRRTFPDAKYVHIHRDGLEAALSMFDYPYFHFATSLFYDPPGAAEIEEIGGNWGDRIDKNPLVRRYQDRAPAAAYGAYWSWQVEQGFSAMPDVRPEQYMDVRFEDLLHDPHGVLNAIADFFEMGAAPGWTDKAVALLKRQPPRFDKLSKADQEALEKACSPGNTLLRRRPNRYFQGVLDDVEAVRNRARQPA